jgi:hypothetical protein
MRNMVFGFTITVIVFMLLVGCSNPKEVEPKPQQDQQASVIQNSPSNDAVKEVNLDRGQAKNVNQLAEIIENVISESDGVQSCFVLGADKEVSTGGYWLSSEVEMKPNKTAESWMASRNAVLAAYSNMGTVPLKKVSIDIITPETGNGIIALQVVVGRNFMTTENINRLRSGTTNDFRDWIKNNRTREISNPKDYAQHLWVDGLLSR